METAMAEPAPHERLPILDGVGASCATFTPIVAARIRQLEPGERLAVVADDPSAPEAIASWARLTGNPLVETVEEGPGRWRFVIERRD
jgi:TusA-related sulfurtransferase